MKASDLFVKALENEGVRDIFGVPGEENLDLLESLRNSSIRFLSTRTEAGAGFMAAAVGRLTGRAGVALSTLGPGATNLVTAVAYANLGAAPALFITGQKPVRNGKQGNFQIVDTVEIMRPITKFSRQIVEANKIPALVREAFRTAEEERPGAVHLELPEDIASEIATHEIFEVRELRRPIAEEKALSMAVKMITSAKRPLMLVGAGANRKRVSKTLLEFLEKTGIPFFTTQMGKGVVSDSHPLCLGTAALSEHDFLHCIVDSSDLVVNIGHDAVEKPPFIQRRDGPKVIHVNFYSASIDDVYFPDLEVIGDIANTLWQFSERTKRQAHWDFSYFFEIKDRFLESIAQDNKAHLFPISPQRIVEDVREVLPEDGIVALDNGMFKLWFARGFSAFLPNTLLLDNALATMGAGLPTAIAAKLINPQKKVLCVAGDGGFMMSVAELETAVRLELDLIILLINDGGYGMIRWKQKAAGFPSFGMEFDNPKLTKLAESFGAHGHRVEHVGELLPLLQNIINSKGVHLIDVPVDYSENERVFTQMMRKEKC